MLFSSITFLYYFLPLVLVLYFVLPEGWRNGVLLVFSLLFYFYGETGYTLLLLGSSAIDFVVSRVINRYRGTPKAKIALVFSILTNILILGFFKYADFLIGSLNGIFGTHLRLLHIHLPLGVSFFTFQTMSYTVDVYRGSRPQKNWWNFATYVTMFPQLVAGPIVRYHDVEKEIEPGKRRITWEGFAYGILRFVVGLSKKVLLANQLGELQGICVAANQPSVVFYWLGAAAFSLQIYFDFSGYSDMAIGLGRMFGFQFPENFNYPYISRSITEFWRRWHISLGTWFREYLYIPLGGNRVSGWKWVRNILAVWAVTGLWHGASWNFILWGLFFGIFLVMEKLLWGKFLQKCPGPVGHLYTLILVLFSFVLFQTEDLRTIGIVFSGMFGGIPDVPLISGEAIYYLRSYGVVLLFSVIGATPLVKTAAAKLMESAGNRQGAKQAAGILQTVCLLGLFLLTTAYLVDSSFNPFLYFRF